MEDYWPCGIPVCLDVNEEGKVCRGVNVEDAN